MKITIIGGGSVTWSPGLIRDILLTRELEQIEFYLLDLNLEYAQTIKRLGEKLASDWQRDTATFHATQDQEQALSGADFIIITISTGGLDAMQHDLTIPEQYRIYQTVGDTVGPGGWARALRNIPVFAAYADKIRQLAPQAVILNYTNPMSVLTRVLALKTNQPVVGLCHGLFESYAVLQSIFGLESERDIKANVAGINHFFWLLELRIRGEDGYRLLRNRMQDKSFDTLIKQVYTDGAGFNSNKLVASELFEQYGYLPYVGDRHICEFFSHYLTNLETLERYRLVRTSIADRRRGVSYGREWVQRVIDGSENMEKRRSRESAADIIAAMSLGQEFVDVVNLLNHGQIANLSTAAVVETLGVVNNLGFTALTAGPLPQPLLNLVLPHVINQEMIVQAGLTGDRELALTALANDPLCRHLTYPEIKGMGLLLMQAHRAYLPQFF